MSRYSVIIKAGNHSYSFGIDTLGGVFELLANSGDIKSFEVIEWTNGEGKTIHAYAKPVLTSI